MISNNNGILSKTKGTLDSVKIPFKVKLMSNFFDFFMMIHNHPLDGVIPSLDDLLCILGYNSKYGVITDSRNVGILINRNDSFNKKYIEYLEKDYNNLENNLFGIFVCNNIEEFTKDFNHHMKNYNVELLFIKIIKVKKEILS